MEHGLVGGVGREKRLNGSRGYLPGRLGYIIHLLLIPTYDECLLRVLCLSSLNDLIHRESKNTYLVWYTETNNIIYFAWSFNLGLIFPPKKVQRKNESISFPAVGKSRQKKKTMSEQRKAVIKNADMSEEMQQDAVDIASQALAKYNIEKVSPPPRA